MFPSTLSAFVSSSAKHKESCAQKSLIFTTYCFCTLVPSIQRRNYFLQLFHQFKEGIVLYSYSNNSKNELFFTGVPSIQRTNCFLHLFQQFNEEIVFYTWSINSKKELFFTLVPSIQWRKSMNSHVQPSFIGTRCFLDILPLPFFLSHCGI